MIFLLRSSGFYTSHFYSTLLLVISKSVSFGFEKETVTDNRSLVCLGCCIACASCVSFQRGESAKADGCFRTSVSSCSSFSKGVFSYLNEEKDFVLVVLEKCLFSILT